MRLRKIIERPNANPQLAKYIGEQLFKLREHHNMTQKIVAEKIDMSHGFICALENGQSLY